MDEIIAYWQEHGRRWIPVRHGAYDPAGVLGVGHRARAGRQPDVWFMAEAYNDDPQKLTPADPVVASLHNVMFSLLNAGFNAVYDDPSYKALKAIYDGPRWANDLDGGDQPPISSIRTASATRRTTTRSGSPESTNGAASAWKSAGPSRPSSTASGAAR